MGRAGDEQNQKSKLGRTRSHCSSTRNEARAVLQEKENEADEKNTEKKKERENTQTIQAMLFFFKL